MENKTFDKFYDLETWTVLELKRKVKTDRSIIVPEMQRGIVWGTDKQEAFIDSLVKGNPFGVILLSKPSERNHFKYEIIDGLQRVNSILKKEINRKSILDSEVVSLKIKKILESYSDGYKDLIVDSQKLEKEKTFIHKILNIVEWDKNLSHAINAIIFNEHIGKISVSPKLFVETELLAKQILGQMSFENQIIPVIIYDFEKNGHDTKENLFEKINKGGIGLNKYNVYAATWHNYKVVRPEKAEYRDFYNQILAGVKEQYVNIYEEKDEKDNGTKLDTPIIAKESEISWYQFLTGYNWYIIKTIFSETLFKNVSKDLLSFDFASLVFSKKFYKEYSINKIDEITLEIFQKSSFKKIDKNNEDFWQIFFDINKVLKSCVSVLKNLHCNILYKEYDRNNAYISNLYLRNKYQICHLFCSTYDNLKSSSKFAFSKWADGNESRILFWYVYNNFNNFWDINRQVQEFNNLVNSDNALNFYNKKFYESDINEFKTILEGNFFLKNQNYSKSFSKLNKLLFNYFSYLRYDNVFNKNKNSLKDKEFFLALFKMFKNNKLELDHIIPKSDNNHKFNWSLNKLNPSQFTNCRLIGSKHNSYKSDHINGLNQIFKTTLVSDIQLTDYFFGISENQWEKIKKLGIIPIDEKKTIIIDFFNERLEIFIDEIKHNINYL